MFARRVVPQTPPRRVCSSNPFLFMHFRTLCQQWSTPNSFAIYHFRTLFHSIGGCGGIHRTGVKVMLKLLAEHLKSPRRVEQKGRDLSWFHKSPVTSRELLAFSEDNRRAAVEAERARGTAFVHSNLQEAARSQIGEGLAVVPLRKGLEK